MTGHYMAACQVKRDKIKIEGKIKWFYTHKGSRHGFCDNCGAAFKKPTAKFCGKCGSRQ